MKTHHYEGTDYVLYGFPYCGKGTLADPLKNHEEIEYIGTGDLIREKFDTEPDSEFTRRYTSVVAEGGYVDDEDVLELYYKRLEKVDWNKRLILDGIPRTVRQGKDVLSDLVRRGRKVGTFHLDHITTDMCRERQRKRAEKRVKAGLPPRIDDKPEVVKDRIDQFLCEHPSLLSYLQEHTKVFVLDATRRPDMIIAEAKLIIFGA